MISLDTDIPFKKPYIHLIWRTVVLDELDSIVENGV